ncbi:alcohol dehydrogenase [Bifidobacterium callimiconis]|uniref:Alcohol dehydrogenase n=1 Tax=Bifidobacterium callimiconis TaxID=2306973 RepID=A0A430FCW3_9BIFI|nr:alcohol dehydrogenase [Bifidobacterium callimiconis]RSX50679.1 alcohol dehydrogenase [Bifidobacterium callimiconis]
MPLWGRILVSAASGALVGFVGAAAHRMGVQWSIPYGLVLSFLLLGISTWSARARSGSAGVGFHLIASGAVTMLILQMSTQSRAMLIFGYTSDSYTFFMQKTGIIWMLGMVALQVFMLLLLPKRWFDVPDRRIR